MPVLPAVPSTRVSPGLISPRFSAASIIDRPMRSLIEPPGFMAFELQVELAEAGVEVLGLDDRRLADQLEYALMDGHALPLCDQGGHLADREL